MEFSPSGPLVNCTATITGQLVVVASNQSQAVIKLNNTGTTVGLVMVASASATAGEMANAVRLATAGELYMNTSNLLPFVYVTAASGVFAQAGYRLK